MGFWQKAPSSRTSMGTVPSRCRTSLIRNRRRSSAPLESWTLPGRLMTSRIWPVWAR